MSREEESLRYDLALGKIDLTEFNARLAQIKGDEYVEKEENQTSDAPDQT